MTHKVSLLKHAHGPNWVIRSPSCYTTMHCWTYHFQGIFYKELNSFLLILYSFQKTLYIALQIYSLLMSLFWLWFHRNSKQICTNTLQNEGKPWKHNKNTDFIPASRHFLVQWLHTEKIPTCLQFSKKRGIRITSQMNI